MPATRLPATALYNHISACQVEPANGFLVGQLPAERELQQAQADRRPQAHVFASAPLEIMDLPAMVSAVLVNGTNHAPCYDWCYIESAGDPQRPICLPLLAGQGLAFYQLLRETSAPLSLATLPIADEAHRQQLGALLAEGSITVKMLVSHQQAEAPVVYCQHVTEERLFGTLAASEQADLNSITAGDLHKANGGYLLLPAAAMRTAPTLWFRLKAALLSQQLPWQPVKNGYAPEPVPLSLKLILLGDRQDYLELLDLDRELPVLAPYFAEFKAELPLEEAPALAAHLAWRCQQHNWRPATDDALATLLQYSCRLAEDQQRLLLAHHRFDEVLARADTLTQGENIDAKAIAEAIAQRQHALALPQHVSQDSILRQHIIIDSSGTKVGQVNGLTVLDLGNVVFGEPTRITATVHFGDGDVMDIERKCELGGNLHAKGVMILSAFIASHFAKQNPLPLSASLVFEQSYNEVDGDSASAAELVALLSALAELPVRQDIAITGAVDQFGNVQAIGAINAKVEGFYALCKARGLSGEQGVLIPHANAQQLMLSQEMRQAVTKGRFHIWVIEHIEDALALLLATPVGKANPEGQYPADSVYGRIHASLVKLNDPDEGAGSLWNLFKTRFKR